MLTGDTTLHFLIISGLSDSSKTTDQYHPVESQLYSDVIVYCDRGGAVGLFRLLCQGFSWMLTLENDSFAILIKLFSISLNLVIS